MQQNAIVNWKCILNLLVQYNFPTQSLGVVLPGICQAPITTYDNLGLFIELSASFSPNDFLYLML